MCNLLSQRAHPLCPDIIKHACFVYVIYSIMLHDPSTIIFLPTRIAITIVFPLRVLLRSKAVPIRRMNILPEIPRPNPWDMWSIVAIRLNVACGNSVNHPVTPKLWNRTNNIATVHWCITTLQPIMMNHRNLTFARPYFVINTHPTNNFKWPNPLRPQFPSFRPA